VASHLGRPDGAVDPAYSMEPVARRLAELMDCEVRIPDEVVGDGARKLVTDTRAEAIVMLENLRFHPGETKNDPEFAKQLASMCDAYVNDAFGVSHRAHASVHALPLRVHDRAPGRLMEAEIKALSRVVHSPERPFVAIVGGAKVSDKLSVLVALVERLQRGDALLIGGAMANTFLASRGKRLGASKLEKDRLVDCERVLQKAEARDIRVLLPSDVRVASSLEATQASVVGVDAGVHDDEMALDIGPDTEVRFAAALKGARTVFWNGPMGVFENPALAGGTLAVAHAVAGTDAFTVVGGGDSVAAIQASGLAARISHISTGGGASLELVEGRVLPGIEVLARGEA
jgi:phosphoglycerate kinase